MRENRDDAQLREKVEVLDGSGRATARPQAAVRLEDINAILEIADELRSSSVSSTPTAAQYNALFEDVRDLHNRLRQVSEALTKRLVGQ